MWNGREAEVEEQQRQMRQTYVNTVESQERYNQQTGRTNLPNPIVEHTTVSREYSSNIG